MMLPRIIRKKSAAPFRPAMCSCRGLMALFFFIPLLWSPSAGAAPFRAGGNSASMKNKKEPIKIRSDRMEAYNKKNLIIFIGTVIAVQGQMEIRSDRLEVHLKKQKKNSGEPQKRSGPAGTSASSSGRGQGGVERLIATGNVRITQGKEKYATADRLDYNETAGRAVLTGNPRAWEKNNQIIGTKIEIFLREGRTIVYGSPQRRVSVTLFPNNRPNVPAAGVNGR